MSHHVTATLNGQPLLSARVSLLRGGRPSRCEATLPPGRDIEPGEPMVLRVTDGGSSREFSQFVARRVTTLGDGRRRVIGTDRREAWQRPVRVSINVPVGDGTSWPEGGPLGAQAALEALFKAAGLADTPVLPPGLPAPVGLRAAGSLGSGVEQLLARLGLSITVDDHGDLQVAPADEMPVTDTAAILETAETQADSAPVTVIGGPALELLELTAFEPVIADDDGALRPLAEVLAAWGIAEADARQACLSEGGFENLLPRTTPRRDARLAALKRCAFRLFRATGATLPWLPVGGLLDDGSLVPPKLEAGIDRSSAKAPRHPRGRVIEKHGGEPVEGFEIDVQRGLVYLARPPLDTGDTRDPTFQARRLAGPPRLKLTIAVLADRPPFVLGDGEPVLHAPHLAAVYRDGQLINRPQLARAAEALAALRAGLASRSLLLAGVGPALANGGCAEVTVAADASGLTTRVLCEGVVDSGAEDGAPTGPLASAGGPVPAGLYQPINAYRAGPLVLAAADDVPEGESVLAMSAARIDAQTAAFELTEPGPLALPFHLPSDDAAKFGRWFFVAGAEVAPGGRLRVLAPDDRHAELPPDVLFKQRHQLPEGLRGLLVNIGDNVCVDTGPLTAHVRGRDPGATSSLVHDLDGSKLSERKRGGLQFLTVLALSPAHRAEGCRDHGWTPVLNLREGDTDSPEVLGRGLFAEGDGRSLGRLAAASQGGPVLADSAHCSKHSYGVASDDDGLYRECAGHISTDAFFKVPGDAIHDAPLKFYAQPFAGRVPAWRPYEAQIKYDADEQHPWNRQLREGRWKIQYRVPFMPDIPPTWRPPITPPVPPVDDPPVVVPAMSWVPDSIRPVITEHEVWAPSHDWLPAPSRRDAERDIPCRGPSITSEGWAAEVDGVPDPSLGGGCIYLPPGKPMPLAQQDSGERRTFLALHPEVALAFGRPHFDSGRVHSGWALRLAAEGNGLELAPLGPDGTLPPLVDQSLNVAAHASIAGDLNVGGKLTVAGLIDPTGLELTPQAANPGGTPAHTLWLDSGSGNRPRVGADGLALLGDLAGLLSAAGNLAGLASPGAALLNLGTLRLITAAYTGTGTSGLTVTLAGINRAYCMFVFRNDVGTGIPACAMPLGDTGAVRWRDAGNSSADTISLDAPAAGVSQVLTINNTATPWNADTGAYRLLVVGTST